MGNGKLTNTVCHMEGTPCGHACLPDKRAHAFTCNLVAFRLFLSMNLAY
jgi:hypothetical protein